MSGVLALAALAAVPAGTQQVAGAHDQVRLVSSSPTNAGKVYRWGNSQWHDGFVEPLRKAWRVNKPRLVRNQHGMLTINATATSGTVAATYTGHVRRYGRWETRIRAEQYTRGSTPYRVTAELVPSGAYHCGARNLELATYRLGSGRAHMAIRNLPAHQFTASKARDLGPGRFHTYAVEVTRRHISWFVDTRVVMTERRPAALSGARFSVRFRMVARRGARMNPGRMQMDWVRYYTLARPNARSIAAPRAHLGTYRRAC